MKTISKQLLATAIAVSLSACAFAANYMTTQMQLASTTPDMALAKLKAGNQRFMRHKTRDFDFYAKAKTSAKKGQFPVAFVLNCVDSRVDSNLVFDQGIGNLFTGSVAGNLIDPYMLASMEFATKAVGSRLVVIMGHTHCGAIYAGCTGKGFGHIKQLITAIGPSAQVIKAQDPKGKCSDPEFVDKIAKQNVIEMIHLTLKQSPILAGLQKSGKIRVVGAMQDIATGKVTFFDTAGKSL